MKILVKVLIGIAGLLALVLIAALFTKNDYTIQKQIVINQPKQAVYDYVKLLKNSDHFNKWNMADPTMKKEYRGTDGTPGFVYAWESKKDEVGKGEQEIKSITAGDSTQQAKLGYEIRFIKPFEGKADSELTLIPEGADKTVVKWHFESKMMYPMNIVLLFVNMDNLLGKDLEETLLNLKTVVEKN